MEREHIISVVVCGEKDLLTCGVREMVINLACCQKDVL